MSDPKTDAGFRQHVLERRFTIVQQPVIDLETRKPIHVEWLVRFDADESLEGLLRPAEISGAIAALDITMLKQAIRTLNLDKRRQPIAVNLSGASMEGPGFETQLFSALDTLTGDPSRLMLELTESWDLRDLSVTADILKTVRQRGHETCLDDVGALDVLKNQAETPGSLHATKRHADRRGARS